MSAKRKKHETAPKAKKADNTKVLALILAAALIVVVFLFLRWMEKPGSPSTTTLKQSTGDGTAGQGDIVEVEYTGEYVNGTVFDTSMQDVAIKASIYNLNREYKPIVFTLGLNEVIPGVEEAVFGMKVGEEKTVTIPPEKGYGEWNPDDIQEIPRIQNTSRIEEVELELFENATGETPVVGEMMNLPTTLWPIEILAIENGTVIIQHYPENGTIVPTMFGNVSLTVTDDRIYATLELKAGEVTFTPLGYLKVLKVTDTMVTLDANHELAGQTIVFSLKLVSINQKEDPYADQIRT